MIVTPRAMGSSGRFRGSLVDLGGTGGFALGFLGMGAFAGPPYRDAAEQNRYDSGDSRAMKNGHHKQKQRGHAEGVKIEWIVRWGNSRPTFGPYPRRRNPAIRPKFKLHRCPEGGR
jgi:hypothetical protein